MIFAMSSSAQQGNLDGWHFWSTPKIAHTMHTWLIINSFSSELQIVYVICVYIILFNLIPTIIVQWAHAINC